jgi:hypothetical protein
VGCGLLQEFEAVLLEDGCVVVQTVDVFGGLDGSHALYNNGYFSNRNR